MTTIPDYEFYTSQYKGNLINTESDFNRLAVRANSEILRLEGSLTVTYFDITDGRNMAVCNIAEEIQRTESAKLLITGGSAASKIKSVSVGSVSVSSGEMTAEEAGLFVNGAPARYYESLSTYANIFHGGGWCV